MKRRNLHVPRGVRLWGWILLGLAACVNEWTAAWLLHRGIPWSPAVRVLLAGVDLALIALGSACLSVRRVETLFRIVLGACSVCLTLAALLVASEGLLAWAERNRPRTPKDVLTAQYAPFGVQHLHPFYFFFFPQDEAAIRRINNETVSIDREGFRGPGPDARGSRKLAFLIGGSAAFGWGSSRNDTTIAGYLNTLQSEYHVVNAGVPSWNSTQEFSRLAMQLLDYQPALILAYSGRNDAQRNFHYASEGWSFPPGTPESFEYLARHVDDIRAEKRLVSMNWWQLRALVLPRTVSAVNRLFRGAPPAAVPSARAPSNAAALPPALVASAEAGAKTYARNLELMSRLAQTSGAQFIAFWQASATQHDRLAPEEGRRLAGMEPLAVAYLKTMHQAVFARVPARVGLVDFSRIFDSYLDGRPAGQFFLDDTHLTDEGNAVVADAILEQLARRGIVSTGSAAPRAKQH